MKKQKAKEKEVSSNPSQTAPKKQKSEDEMVTFSFSRQNYRLLIIGVLIITLGFLLMIGGGSEDPNVFNFKMFNFQRLTLAPILIITGYIIEIFAIMKRPKS